MKNFFTNMYSINKTLRFELKPYGKTDETYKKTDLYSAGCKKGMFREDDDIKRY